MKTSKDQLDYNFSRNVDFQKKIENIKDEDIENLGLNNISPIKKKHLKFLITDLFSAWKESPLPVSKCFYVKKRLQSKFKIQS